MIDEVRRWRGLGKWLSFTTAALLIAHAVPGVFERGQGAAAGWDIFLGLVLFGVIASGNKYAPVLALLLTVLMVTRLALMLVFRGSVLDVLLDTLLVSFAAGGAWGLRKQAKLIE